MKQTVGWRPLVMGGLASVATVLAVLSLIHQIREALPPPEVHVLPNSGYRPPEGPAMRIEPDDLARAGRERNDNGLRMTFCWCPSGSFHMGRVGTDRRSAVHNPYYRDGVGAILRHGSWMGKFEVTQVQWRRVMGVTLREQFAMEPERIRQLQAGLHEAERRREQLVRAGSQARDPERPPPVGDDTLRDNIGEGPDYPIYFINHTEAEEFCRKLTEAERVAGRLEPGWEYRLPTEAQWEFACRAGTTTATAFGDRLSSTQANFDGSMPLNGAPSGPYLNGTTPVGSYAPNAWGLHDMHGNLYEWCRDGFTGTPRGGTDPLEDPVSPKRTMRGGCWHNPGSACESTSRAPGEVSGRGWGLGFRVALVPSGL